MNEHGNCYFIHDKKNKKLILNGRYIPTIKEIEKFFNISDIKIIKTGSDFFLILLKNNLLYTFGDNSYGQCGKNITQSIELSPIKINLNNKIKDIYCTTYTSYVLLENGDLYAFGMNVKTHIPQKVLMTSEIKSIFSEGTGDDIFILTNKLTLYIHGIEYKYPTIFLNNIFCDFKNFWGNKKKGFILYSYNKIQKYFTNNKNKIELLTIEKYLKIEEKRKEKIKKIINVSQDNSIYYLTSNGEIYKESYIILENNKIYTKIYKIDFFFDKIIIDMYIGQNGFILILTKDGIVYKRGNFINDVYENLSRAYKIYNQE